MNSIDRDALIKFIPQKYISEEKKRFTALDIFDFEGVLDADKVNTSIRLDLIEPEKLHEFACRCAERALSRVEHPDPRSVAVIKAKRAWLRGEITDAELAAARGAAWDAERDAERDAAWAAERDAAWAAAWAAARAAARDAAWAAARDAAWAAARAAASAAARAAASAAARAAAWAAASDAERAWQVEELKKMLREDEA